MIILIIDIFQEFQEMPLVKKVSLNIITETFSGQSKWGWEGACGEMVVITIAININE